ncbi:MAG: hypothetical protein KU37_07165 [Sulfuricurvum sp. PC08-66]|nr:MAG: hypothetical protein KU37_07165 [Sulfuricurvum sp. PC08-66]
MRGFVLLFLGAIFASATTLEERLSRLEERLTLGTQESQLVLGGRIQIDSVLSSQSVGGAGGSNGFDYLFGPQSIKAFDANEAGEISANAQNSRLFVQTRTPTQEGVFLESLVEIDFGGVAGNERVANAHAPRLRHAYMSYAGWLVGQSFSTFMGGEADVEQNLMDVVFVRQPMVRYSYKQGAWQLDSALELPETTTHEANVTADVTPTAHDDDRVPDAVVRIGYSDTAWALQSAFLGRYLRADTHTAWGYGINVHATYTLPNRDSMTIAYRGGSAIGRYMVYNYFADALLSSDVSLKPLDIFGWHGAYRHWWSDTLRSTLAYSAIAMDSSAYIESASMTQSAFALHANLRYAPLRNVLWTLEGIYATRYWGRTNAASMERVMVSLRYDF